MIDLIFLIDRMLINLVVIFSTCVSLQLLDDKRSKLERRNSLSDKGTTGLRNFGNTVCSYCVLLKIQAYIRPFSRALMGPK